MDKKADVPFMVIMMIAAVTVLFVLLLIAGKVFNPAATQITEQQITIHMSACKLKGIQLGAEKVKVLEELSYPEAVDKYPNSCDVCPYGKSGVDEDEDGDGIPKTCDADDSIGLGKEKGCDKDKNLRWYKDFTQCLCKADYEWKKTGATACTKKPK